MLKVEDTIRSYSGKPGCMCGCLGEYKESERARKLAITQILKQDWDVQTWGDHPNYKGKDFGCIYVESNTRNRVLYLTKEGAEKAKAMKAELLEEAALGHS